MSNTFGLFVNLDYAHKPKKECALIWHMIMDEMLAYGFSIHKRAFTINTDKTRDELSIEVRHVLDKLQLEHMDLFAYIKDCYIINLAGSEDLTLPDTSESIDVEDISLEDLHDAGIKFDLFPK